MAIDHLLRLTVRVTVGNFNRELDLAVPAGSSLAEILDEVLGLANAPRISRPWQASTAAGSPVDQAEPLENTGLNHGDVLLLAPTGDRHQPVVRDAAEALVETTAAVPVTGLSTLAAVAGAGALTLWLLGPALLATVPDAVLFTAAAVACLAVLAWRRRARLLVLPAVGLSAAAGATAVLPGIRPEPADLAWALLSGVAVAAVALTVTGLLGATRPRALGALATLLVMALVAALALGSTGTLTGTAAGVVAAAVLALLLAPTLATQLAGLKIPPLPSAGQDLAVSDRPDPGIDDRAVRAVELHDGFLLGLAAALAPAVLAVGVSGGGFPQGLCAATAGCLLLHSARHRSAVATWSLFSAGIVALLAMVLAAVLGSGHPAQLVPAGVVAVAGLTAPLWSGRIPELQPTTVVWLERIESVAIIAAIPLAAHLMGVFSAIRGLG